MYNSLHDLRDPRWICENNFLKNADSRESIVKLDSRIDSVKIGVSQTLFLFSEVKRFTYSFWTTFDHMVRLFPLKIWFQLLESAFWFQILN